MNDVAFWAAIDKSGGPNACWPWTRARSGGYGHVNRDGKVIASHRVAYGLTSGPIPSGLFLMHGCDNPPCCNPAHLFPGTNADNMADAIRKGRGPWMGLRHLTPEQADEIRLSEERAIDIAARMGVPAGTVVKIRRGEIYRTVGEVRPTTPNPIGYGRDRSPVPVWMRRDNPAKDMTGGLR